MSFSFHPEAEIEFNNAIDYYEGVELGLGYDFAIEVYSTIKRTVSLPKAWSVIDGYIRRSLVKRFPYGVLYSEENNGIYIVAVMHLHLFLTIGSIESDCRNRAKKGWMRESKYNAFLRSYYNEQG